jgi:hypothetical protein
MWIEAVVLFLDLHQFHSLVYDVWWPSAVTNDDVAEDGANSLDTTVRVCNSNKEHLFLLSLLYN